LRAKAGIFHRKEKYKNRFQEQRANTNCTIDKDSKMIFQVKEKNNE
jgi:hypothetical protein